MNALSERKFLIYFVSNTLSVLGVWIQKVALGWFAWQISGSTFLTSIVAIGLMAPPGILGPFIAVYAENWDFKFSSILIKSLMFTISFIIWLMQINQLHTIETLIILSFILGILTAFYHPIRLVYVTIIVSKNLLPSAIGLNSTSWNGSRVLGPAIAGLSITSIGLENTLLCGLFFSIPMIFALIFISVIKREIFYDKSDRFINRILEGINEINKKQIILVCLVAAGINSFFIRSILEIQPAIIGQIFSGNSIYLAYATASAGFGALLSSLLIGSGKLKINKIKNLIFPSLIVGFISIMLVSFSKNIFTMSFTFLICGSTTTIVGIGAQSIIQLSVKENFRTRVVTWWSTISFACITFGGLIVGAIGDKLTINYGILLSSVIGIICTGFYFIYLKKRSNQIFD